MIELIAGVGVSGVIVGLTQLIKKSGYVNDRLIPFIPFVLSFLILLLAITQVSFQVYIMSSIVYGLIANGLYTVPKNVIKK